jgi:Chaperone of endosialidase
MANCKCPSTIALAALLIVGCTNGSGTSNGDGPGSTAISSRRLKDDITYVSPTELDQLKDQLLAIRLATFRYKRGDQARHLGFILEDSPNIPASDMARSQVDLYGYASMAVATLQVQARQIEQLEADVDALSNEVESLAGRRHLSSLSCSPHARLAPSAAELAENER